VLQPPAVADTVPPSDRRRFRRATTLIILVVLALAFAYVIRDFLVPLFLGAIFASLAEPLYRWFLRRVKKRPIAAGLTLTVLILSVIIPLLALLGLIADQALTLSQEVVPWVTEQVGATRSRGWRLPEWFPFRDYISPQTIRARVGALAENIGTFLVANISVVSKYTAEFFLDLFVMLYAMYTFFVSGHALHDKVSALLALSEEDKEHIFERGKSVARATLKGTIVIGFIQGALGGIALQFAGFSAAALWGAVMAVASVIPAVGTALVWVPAVAFLFLSGDTGLAIGLTFYFALVVGSVDNLLRPKLVGSDTQLPDLLVLVSTLGGLAVFGMAGLIIGPLLGATFITMLDVYQASFKKELDPRPTEPPLRSG
jgi:predicted PurR-regulated permease PerM